MYDLFVNSASEMGLLKSIIFPEHWKIKDLEGALNTSDDEIRNLAEDFYKKGAPENVEIGESISKIRENIIQSLSNSANVVRDKQPTENIDNPENSQLTNKEAIKSTSSISEQYTNWAKNIAADDNYGYSMDDQKRWETPDYDCSSLISTALNTVGYGKLFTYTGNEESGLLDAGFKKYTYNEEELKPGDILLYHDYNTENGHTEIYIKDNQTIGAHDNYDKKDGDSSGNEINISENTYGKWEYYFRTPESIKKHTNMFFY